MKSHPESLVFRANPGIHFLSFNSLINTLRQSICANVILGGGYNTREAIVKPRKDRNVTKMTTKLYKADDYSVSWGLSGMTVS